MCVCHTGIWFVGELLSGIYGIVSAHGLIVANTFIPGSMTYLHGCYIVRYISVVEANDTINVYNIVILYFVMIINTSNFAKALVVDGFWSIYT